MKSFSTLPAYGSLLAAAGTLVLGAPSSRPPSSLQRRQDLSGPAAADCSGLGDFIDSQVTVGNDDGGVYACLASWSYGAFPKEIEARADENMLRWIRVVFTDGSEREVGTKPGLDWHDRQLHVKWDPWVNTFSQFSMYYHGWGGGLGRLVIRVNGCQGDNCEGDAGGWVPDAKQFDVPHGADGSGMLLGFSVKHGDGIDSMTPIFSKTAVEKVTLKDSVFDPTFEQLNEKPFAERQMEAMQLTHVLDNTMSESEANLWIDSSMGAENQHKVSDVKEDGSELGGELGLTAKGEVSWEAGVPGWASGGSKAGLEGSAKFVGKHVQKDIHGDENTKVDKVTVRFRVSHKVPGGGMVRCMTTVLQSRANLRFKATLENRFKDGTSYSYPVTGLLEDANHSEAYTECEDVKPEDVGTELELTQGAVTDGDTPSNEGGTVIVVPGAITESGTYCQDGTKVSDVEMSDEEYFAACPQ
ncbi:hypothetical protein FDECE_11122 [Fusarium decemcellulare]|nr:hypothetical protein FDECE_11122 [Fusarium decemcellulare]